MGMFRTFRCMVLLLIFSAPYVVSRMESIKLVLPVGDQQVALKLKPVFQVIGDENGEDRLYEFQVCISSPHGRCWLLLKAQFKLRRPPFVPAIVATMISSILDVLQVFSGLKVMFPLKNGVELVIRIQEVLDDNQNLLYYKIDIGTRRIQGYSFLFEARFR